MASKKLSTDTSLANSYKLSRGVASVARPSAPTIGTATDGGSGNMSVTFTASTLGPTASSFTLTSSSGVTGSGASSPLTLQEVATGTYTYSISGVNANGTGPSSAASNSVVVASVFAPSGAYDSIATTTLTTNTASITFSSIPATYTHLQIRLTNLATVADNILVQYNSDTASNYGFHWLYGNGSSASAYASSSASNMALGYTASTTASYTGAAIIDILDYANTSKNTTARSLNGSDDNSTGGYILFSSGLWRNTAAITSVLIYPQSGNFKQYTSAALYGIKGA